MGDTRQVDRTKKTNIKCEHCKYWDKPILWYESGSCKLNNSEKKYYQRCKQFDWKA
jgi:hypothetical protein